MDERILNGLYEYIRAEVMPGITDKGTRVMVAAAAEAVKRNPDRLPMLKQLDREWIDAIAEAVRECGGLDITIPAVPLISQNEKKLTFTESDLQRLMAYIS